MFIKLIALFLYLFSDAFLCNPVNQGTSTSDPPVLTESSHRPLQEQAVGPTQDISQGISSQQKDLKDLYARMERIRCGRPRLKVINIYEELQVVREFGYNIYPECELVPRCQGSGCCGSVLSECVATEKRNISIKVLTNLNDPSKPPRFQNITLSSDTKCGCKEAMPPKKHCSVNKKLSRGKCICRQPCAEPFTQDPETCDCVCEKNTEEKRCSKILSGERYMGGSHCKCVQDGVCQPIHCNKGLKFNYRLCICETKY